MDIINIEWGSTEVDFDKNQGKKRFIEKKCQNILISVNL